jgi:hypothetical protein
MMTKITTEVTQTNVAEQPEEQSDDKSDKKKKDKKQKKPEDPKDPTGKVNLLEKTKPLYVYTWQLGISIYFDLTIEPPAYSIIGKWHFFVIFGICVPSYQTVLPHFRFFDFQTLI